MARRFDTLSPAEFVALDRLAVYCDETVSEDGPGATYLSGLRAGVNYVRTLPERNLERARAIYTAYADSSLAEERELVANWYIQYLVQADHDYGFTLWDRLIRDTDATVREAAYSSIAEALQETLRYTPREGDGWWLAPNHLAELAARAGEAFTEQSGLTSADALRLLESHALAEAGFHLHDLACAALAKFIAARSENPED